MCLQQTAAARELISLAPLLRGEGRGEGLSQRARLAEGPPHPTRSLSSGAHSRDPLAPTSPRKRDEVSRARGFTDHPPTYPLDHFIGHLSWKLSWLSLTMVETVLSE